MKPHRRSILPTLFPFLRNEENRLNWVRREVGAISAGQSLLDAGAGECQYKPYCGHLRYVSQDFAQYNGIGDMQGLQTSTWDNTRVDIVSDIRRIPVSGNSFDNILCTEVLEHIPYPDEDIREFSRIVKPGGRLFLTAPFCSITHFSPYHYCTGFNRYWYNEVLPRHGFDIISIDANGNFFDYVCQELLRLPSVIRAYTKLSVAGYLLYFLTLPLLILLTIVSIFGKNSNSLLCFGYHVVAEKSLGGNVLQSQIN